MQQTIVLASGNKGKLIELEHILAPAALKVILQQQLEVPEADETGLTFVENAIIKARNACKHSHLPSLADDSGLEVDALQGRPGIYSARYSGPGSTDQSNNEKLLVEMDRVDDPHRSARYHCALVFMRYTEDPCPLIFQGSLEGQILRAPRGNNGFGYDPLFWVPEYNCSVAELSRELKGRISHRAKAMAKLMTQLGQISSAAGNR